MLGELDVFDLLPGLHGPAFAFGPFRLLPSQRVLLEDGKPVRLGSRALDILITLVEHAGELIDKDTLLATVWPGLNVEDATLRVHLTGLRRTLGDGHAGVHYIANVTGRGYRFVAPVTLVDQPAAALAPSAMSDHSHNLPVGHTRIVGRTEIVACLTQQLAAERFISIVGPGGIGKTTVAVAVAERLVAAFRDGVRFVNLAPVSDPQLVPDAIASVLGVAVRGAGTIAGLVAFLRDKQMLLLLDSSEHLVDAVAALTEDLFQAVPGLHLLITSREPLRARGERVQRLAPLGVPPTSAGLTAAAALMYPAVQLFSERAAASLGTYALTDRDAPAVADICRKLDGIALAIELAAGRIDAFGIGGLARLLEDRFRLLRLGRRTALPRQQTMRATLDWSYQLLPEVERIILRRLAVFAGRFTLQAATAVSTDEALSPADVVDLVADLVAKSLVTADFTGNQVFYRLLDTTRAYAMEVLAESGELHALQHRHAAHFQTVFEAGEIEWLTEGGIDWLAAYAGDIDNVRAALDWAFGPDGDEATGVALTAASTPLWMHLSLVLELRGRIERALTSAEAARGQRQDMRLLTALGATLTYAPYQGRDGAAVWCNALALADALRDTDYRLRALWGQWIDRIKSDDFSAALDIAHRFQDLAGNLPEAPIGERMLGLSLFYLGELPRARHHLEHMLSQYAAPVNGSHVIRFQFDQRVSARTSLAQVLWLQGLPDQAANIVETDVPPALASGHGPTLCNALGHGAAAVALMRGDLDALDRHTAMLLDQSIRHGLPTLHAWGRCFEGALLIRRGEVLAGTGTLRSALDALSGGGFKRRSTRFQAEWAMGLGLAGDVPSGLAVIDETLARSEHSRERWYEPELLRIKGELLLIMDIPDVRAAENLFRRAIAVAVEQAALSWELRAASSLALLLHQHRGPTAARDVLQSVHGRFVEGFATADVLKAGALLKEFA